MDRRRNASIALALLALGFTSHAIAAVGRTPGTANVSDTGEASYSIPIFTPPGTNGMTPGLALVYGHRNGTTLVGAGWGITGLSAITRCPKIWAADGQSREPRNDYSDRFCLDGNKLRLTSGTYGNAGATYQTEIETFARITSFGIAGNGPTNFTVVDRNGVTYEYGNTADSRIESVGQSTARVWALNKIRDQSDNRITFTYAEDTVNGAYRIDRIQYTTNPTQGISIAPYEVDFVWQAKPAGEVDAGYMAGSLIKEVNRLDRIDVNSGTTLVRRYELTYEGALSSTMKSRLASIQECAGSPLECFSPTTFVYQNGTAGFGSEVNTAVSMPTTPILMDVNGDGRDDLVYSSSTTSGSGTWMILFANSSGGYVTPATNTGVPNINYSGAMPIDYNADGFGDLMIPSYSGSTWWVMTGSTSGLALPFNTSAPATATGTSARAMDVNGDGLDDLLWADLIGYAGGDAIRYRLRTPGGPTGFSSTISTLVGPYPADERIEAGVFPVVRSTPQRIPDFNGDGRGDVIFRHTKRTLIDGTNPPQYTFRRWLEVVCAGGFSFTVTTPNAAGTPSYGDFNGDGKSDIVYLNQSANIVARYSTGAGFTGEVTIAALGSYGSWAVLDWDHDGKDDVLLSAPTAWFVARSTGQGFAVPVSLGFTGGGFVTDVNGDGLHDFAGIVSGTWRFRLHTLTEADLLLTATDGFGSYSTFSYAPLATYSLYSKQTGAAFPLQDYSGALQVVTNVAASNGIGGSFNLQSFYYEGARVNLQGRGFVGFTYREWIDSRDGTAQRRNYRQDFPYIAAVTDARRMQWPGGPAITQVQTTYATHSYGSGFETRSLPFVSQVTRYDREAGGTLSGALIRTVVQTNTVDAATGVAYDTTTTTTEPASGANGVQPGASYAQRVYQPLANLTTNANCLGKPQRIEQTNSHTLSGGAAITRTTNLTWDTTQCRVTQTIAEPGDTSLQVTRNIGYDNFGNANSDTLIGIGMSARTTQLNFGTDGHFVTKVTNAVGEETELTFNQLFGVPATTKDPNDLQTTFAYDVFGRLIQADRPDGTHTVFTYGACASPSFCGDPLLRSYVEASVRNTGDIVLRTEKQYFDTLGRAKRATQQFVVGGEVTTAINYDALGRVSERVAPRFAGGSSFSTTFEYDLLDRVTSISRPTSDTVSTLQTTQISYAGLTTTVQDPLGKNSSKVSNAVGSIARSADHNGYYQNFSYDAFGSVLSVVDSLSNTLQSNTFNKRGMPLTHTDMDAGGRTFTPNALGELVQEQDAKSQQRTFTYDAIGRLKVRGDPEGNATFTLGDATTSTATNKNIGRLIGMSGPGYSETLSYDDKSRLKQRSITVDGTTYLIDLAYNAEGTLDTLTYPTSTSGFRLKLKYEYANGDLLRVKEFNTTNVFWEATNVDPWGNIINETIGSGANRIDSALDYDLATGVLDSIYSHLATGAGTVFQDLDYSWNAVGSLTGRHDALHGLTEGFGYDDLHRLTSITGPDAKTIAYDAMGNISTKTGVGTYTYHATKKHQVINTSSNPNPYTYDLNGNMKTRNGFAITWYSYDLPNTVNDAGSNSSQFFYAPDRSRWKQVASYAGSGETTLYIGGFLEKVTIGTTTSWKHYIAGATGAVAEYIRWSTGTNETRYLLKDHLGSTDVVMNASGTPAPLQLSFDAFGARRDGADWNGPPPAGDLTTIANTTRRGFTFHEMLDNLKLTHMNGRVYDQVLGRFLSPDPFVPDPGFTQSFNRYSYLSNNPLGATDSSGFGPDFDPGLDPHWDWLDWDGLFHGERRDAEANCRLGTDRQRCALFQRAAAIFEACGFDQACRQEYEAAHPLSPPAAAPTRATPADTTQERPGWTIWPAGQVAAVIPGGIDLSQGEIQASTRRGTIERALRELREAGLVLGSDQVRIDNRYAFVDSLRQPLRAYDIRFADTVKGAYATMNLLNAQPRLVQFEALGGSTTREYLGLVGPYVYTIYAWAAYPTADGSSLDTAKFIILHEIGHGRGGCGIGRETCANDYAERLLNPE